MTDLAYKNDPAFRDAFLAQMQLHAEQDAIAQGTYGELRDGKFRGCSIGCGLHSLDLIDGKTEINFEGYSDHSRWAERLGVPVILAKLNDRIFEGLAPDIALGWPLRFSAAIKAGAELSLVWPKWAHWLLTDDLHGVIKFARTDETRAAIAKVAELFAREIAGSKPRPEEWRDARTGALRYYSWSAAAAAAAADADAADAAARTSTFYAHRRKHFAVMADKLVELLEAA